MSYVYVAAIVLVAVAVAAAAAAAVFVEEFFKVKIICVLALGIQLSDLLTSKVLI